MKLRTNMIQKVIQKFIFSFLLTDLLWRIENMQTYCVKCRKNTENLNSKIFKTKNGRLIMQSKCVECGIKKSRFVKEQEGLSIIGLKNRIIEYFRN